MIFFRNQKPTVEQTVRPVVGIPRALTYYLHPGLWEVFFRELGCRVALSAASTRATVEQAGLLSESEHCLPVKLFDAHLAELAGRVDWLFVPRILSTLAGHTACPKLAALPDCARAQWADRVKILSVDIDQRRIPLSESLARLGGSLPVDRRTIARASERALAAWQAARRRQPLRHEASGLHFLLIGHPYNLHDEFLAAPILETLDRLQVAVERLGLEASGVTPEPLAWDVCSIIYETLRRASPGAWDGVVHLSSFNCGCDSIAGVLYHELLRGKRIPCMTLVMDGLAGQAGLETRLEAFVDSIKEQHEHAATRH